MPHFDVNAVILLLLGSLLTIGGGFATTYFTLHLNSKAAKKTTVREKIEDIYLLTNQIKRWSQSQLFAFSKQKGLQPYQYILDFEKLKQQRPLSDMDLVEGNAALNDLKNAEMASLQTGDVEAHLEYLRKLGSLDPRGTFQFWYLHEPAPELECPIDRVEMLINFYVPQLNEEVETYRTCIFNMKGLSLGEPSEQQIRDTVLLFELSQKRIQSRLEKLALVAK